MLKKTGYSVLLILFTAAVAWTNSGLVTIASNNNFEVTDQRLTDIIKKTGLTVIAQVNHAAAARTVDLDLRPTKVYIFGNPRVGTPLMQCAQTTAIDLPQKMLVWEDATGQVYVTYNDPRFTLDRHYAGKCEDENITIEATIIKMIDALSNLATWATSTETPKTTPEPMLDSPF